MAAKAKERALWTEIKKWVCRLQLGHWRVGWVDVSEDPGRDPDIAASLDADGHNLLAQVEIANWPEVPFVKGYARHEILHLLLDEYQVLINELVLPLDERTRTLMLSRAYTINEHIVLRLCRAFEEVDPLFDDELSVE